MPPLIVELTSPADPRLDALLALYVRAIPARERKADSVIRAMAGAPTHRVAIAEAGGRVVGFYLLFIGEALALLEYMAVDEACRGAGLGGDLYRSARVAAGTRVLVVEVESDREDVPDRALRSRRIGFYRRLGARRLRDLDYILPLPGEGPPPWLDLLVDGVDGDTVPTERVAHWLLEIYVGVYGCAPGDPRLAAMIASRPAHLGLD